MQQNDALLTASAQLRFVEAAVSRPVRDPREPLSRGIFREISPGLWEPIHLAEWSSLSPSARVDVVLAQMRQLSHAIDAAGLALTVEHLDPEAAAFSAAEVRLGLHKALCRLHRELKEHAAWSTLGSVAVSLLFTLFFGDVPLASESPDGALALIVLYGERYCEEAGGARAKT
jgi:hypothetical protein